MRLQNPHLALHRRTEHTIPIVTESKQYVALAHCTEHAVQTLLEGERCHSTVLLTSGVKIRVLKKRCQNDKRSALAFKKHLSCPHGVCGGVSRVRKRCPSNPPLKILHNAIADSDFADWRSVPRRRYASGRVSVCVCVCVCVCLCVCV